MNTLEYQQVLGRRVARERRRQGLSQPELAAIVDQPVGWVSRLERGMQPIERPGVLKSLADALELPLSELAAGAPPAGETGRRRRAADGLRVLLAGAHSLRGLLGESSAPPLSVLRASTERSCALARTGDYDELAAVLGDLLPGLEASVRSVPAAQRPDAYELMAMAYQACSAALAKLDEPLASWVAADRAMSAAEKAGHLLLAAAGQYRLALVFLDSGELGLADEAARTTITALRGLAELDDPEAVSLCGGLTLVRAVIAARTRHPEAAYGHLAKARLLASRLGSRQANGLSEFGPRYVALYEIAVSVELGDAVHALRTAASVDPAGVSPGRQARMLIDVARAYALGEQVDDATAALLRAEQIGLRQGRDRDRARAIIADLIPVRMPPPALLAALAQRLAGSAG